jgi:hypothetical protein
MPCCFVKASCISLRSFMTGAHVGLVKRREDRGGLLRHHQLRGALAS